MAVGARIAGGAGWLYAERVGTSLAKKVQQAAIIAADIENGFLRDIAKMKHRRIDQLLHPIENIGGEACAIMIAAREELLVGDLETLMGRVAAVTEQDFDRVFPATAGLAQRDQIVAHRMRSEVEDRPKVLVAANLAAPDLA